MSSTASTAPTGRQTPVFAAAPALGGTGRTLRLGASRIAYELKSYFRAGDQVFFTFLFPVLLLGVFSSAFSAMGNVGTNPDGSGGVSYATYYLPAMISAGILLSGVQNLGTDIAMERSDGTLKRLGGSPLPVLSYFIGKIGQVFVTGIAQTALLIVVAVFAFGVTLPTDPGSWATFAWLYLLSISTCAVLGIAISYLPKTGKSASAVIIPPLLVLQFISGVYLSFTQLPEWLQNIASVFPLKWIAQGMRSVFLPDSFAVVEQGGAWNLGLVAIVLALWFVVGLVVCRLTFRWIRKDS